MNSKFPQSKPRKGTANKGQDYEILLPALFCLRFLEDPTIKNFVLRSNIDSFGSLDDLLASLYKIDGKEENYAFQLKHKEKQNLFLSPKCFEAEGKHDFSILKYCEAFSAIHQREIYRFIIYTNAHFYSNFHQVTRFDIKCNGECPGKDYFFFPSSETNADIYNFGLNEHTKITEAATREVYTSFFKKFAFYSHQKNWQEVQELIVEQFSRIFNTTDKSVAIAYIDIFKFWKLHEYSSLELNKEDLKIKILDLILSPHILTPRGSSDEKFAPLATIFTNFDFVLVDGLDDASISKIISNPVFEQDEDILHLAKNMKLLPRNVTRSNFSGIETEIQQKIGYYLRGKPIVVKIHKENARPIGTTILKFKNAGDKLHFIFTGEIHHLFKSDLSVFNTFENLHDLKIHRRDIYTEIVGHLNILLNEKEYTCSELFDHQDEILKKIRIKDMFQMLAGNFLFEITKEKLPEPYVSRSVLTTIIRIESIDQICNDIVVISHRGNLKTIELLQRVVSKPFTLVGEYLMNQRHSDSILYENELSLDDFQKICERNPKRNVHFFQVYREEFLEWIFTKGSIAEIKKSGRSERVYTESEIFERFQNNVNVIVANPGMGKSEILKKLKNTCPLNFFPIFINLKEHNAFFKDVPDDEQISDHFLSFANDNDLLLEIKKTFAKNKNVMFFFDGLDELQQENIDIALEHIKKLSSMGFRLWLTSRSHLKDVIENYLNVSALDLKAFTDDEQKEYIRARLNTETFTEEIFKNFSTILENRDILDLPLQLYMITEILTEYSKITSEMFVLTKMFQYFFTGRYRHFFNKSKCHHWDSLEKIVNDSKSYRTKQYQIAALMSSLSRSEFQFLNLKLEEKFVREIQTEGDFLGIILKITHNTVIFHHETTATYFAALWLAENFNGMRDFLKDIFCHEEYDYLRLMFDMILAEDSPTHVAVLYRNIKALEEHKNEIHKIDKGGRSTLHLACSHGCRYSTIRHILEDVSADLRKIDEESRKVLEFLLDEGLDLFTTDSVFEWNCLNFSEKMRFLFPLEVILDKNSRGKYSKAANEIFNLDCMKNNTLDVLRYSAVFSYPKLFQHAFQKMDVVHYQIIYLLHIATLSNSWKIVNILLDKNVDIHAKTESFERTILHSATFFGHIEVVTLLLFRGASIDAVDEFDRTPLHLAAANGHIRTVKKLLEYKPKIDTPDKYGRTPLHLAVEKGNEELIQILIKEGADINKLAWIGWGPLHLAIIENHKNIVKLLLEKKVEIDKIDKYGTKPVHVAAKRSTVEILDLILKETNNIEDITEDARTCLHLAAETGNISTLKYLLENEASINAQDKSGRSVLHWAVIGRHLEIVDLLLKKGCDVSLVDNNRRNCLQWASEMGDLNIVELLLNHMMEFIDDRAQNGSTALHWAANNGSNGIVNTLLSAGAKIDVEDTQNRTPLHWAALEGHVTTVELLLSKNAAHKYVGGKPALEFAKTIESKTKKYLNGFFFL